MTTNQAGRAPVKMYRWSRKPLGIEAWLFIGLMGFFIPLSVIYGLWSQWEPIGTTALALLALMWALVGFFLMLQGRKVSPRPEDHPHANIEDHEGEVGHFAPYSWWPLVLGLAVGFVFLGIALGWWLVGIGFALAIIGLVGHLFEFSRGPHAH